MAYFTPRAPPFIIILLLCWVPIASSRGEGGYVVDFALSSFFRANDSTRNRRILAVFESGRARPSSTPLLSLRLP